jgi:hypothetical protein
MKFYFDESGDFAPPASPSEHSIAISIGIVVPEETEAATIKQFDGFVRGLPHRSFHKGEPKGRLLEPAARQEFADFLWECDGILVCPTVLDLTALAGRTDADVRSSVVNKLNGMASRCKYPQMREQISLLARRFNRLSLPQCLRLVTWARCIMRSLHDSIVAHSGQQFDSSWRAFRFEIDPVQRSAANREELVFMTMLPAWVCAWSDEYPFDINESIHDRDHPLLQYFDRGGGMDLGRIIKGNVHYPPSGASKGLQIADMAATIVASASRGIADAGGLKNYGMIMTRSIGTPLYATGLYSLVEPHNTDWPRRFYGLPESIAAAKHARWGPPAATARLTLSKNLV